MDFAATAATRDETSSPPVVTVRYWAAARAAAGVAEERLSGATLAEVLTESLTTHSAEPRFERVLSVCSFLIGEQPLGSREPADVRLQQGDVVEVLPPFAGG